MFKFTRATLNIIKNNLKVRNAPRVNLAARLNTYTGHKITKIVAPLFVNRSKNKFPGVILALSIITWLGFDAEDEEQESELIMTLKRAVLCTKREQFEKAEQMLHLALRLAQQQQNKDGILYTYDLMANLALERQQLDKAEKLFVSVMQLLFANGIEEDNLKMIHVSLKLARICQYKAELEKAEMGYNWCLEKIEKQRNTSEDARALYGIIQDWYAQFLLDIGQVEKSLKHLKEAHESCETVYGKNAEQTMLLLNDLGITSFRAGDLKSAVNFINQGIQIGEKLDDREHLGVLHANLGLILLQQGAVSDAKRNCKHAWKLGKKHENEESIEQANYCFEQIQLLLGNKQRNSEIS